MPEWLHKYGNVFSKNKSERMPIQKLYNYAIDFVEGAICKGDQSRADL